MLAETWAKTALLFVLIGTAILGGSIVTRAADAPSGHRLDWYDWGKITASPYLTDARSLADGDLETICAHMDGPQAGGWIQVTFPQPVQVTALRFMQTGGRVADTFELRADTEGKGECTEILATVKNETPVVNEWIVVPVNKKVHGLRIAALSGSVGYRSPYPTYKEIEIYTQEPVSVSTEKAESAPARVETGKVVPAPAPVKKTIAFTPCIDLWMIGIQPGDNMPETKTEVESRTEFQNLLQKLRDVDAQGVRMFLESACCENKMPWKSEICEHYGRDTLRGVMEALHANGLTGSLFLHAWISPIQKKEKMLPMPDRRWDYPYEQSDLVAGKGLYEGYEADRYPCVICDDDFRNKWLGLLGEAVDRGVDGVYVLPDEYYFKGHNLDTAKCPACEREFKKSYGYDHLPKLGPGRSGHAAVPGVGPDPRRMADTEPFRKWKLFEYEKLADLFDSIAGELKSKRPDLKLVSSSNPASTFATNRRLDHGLAYDILGRGKNFTHIQLYGDVPLGLGNVGIHTALARRMRGAHRQAELLSSIQSLSFKSLPTTGNEIRFIGYVLPHVMAGAKGIDLYRLNYVDGEWWPVIAKGISMVRLLEDWGVHESTSAAETCLLLSRASEDWWQVRAQSLLGLNETGEADIAKAGGAPLLHFEEQIGNIRTLSPAEAELKIDFERFRGMYAGKSMESMLLENGVQYDVLYAEREDTLGEIGKYKLLVLPFPYSMSEKTFSAIKSAVEKGSKLLIVDKTAPTNEFGAPYPQPLLKELLGHPNVVFIDENLAVTGTDPALRREIRKKILSLLGEKGNYFNGNGARIEYLARKSDNGMLLYLANWEKSGKAEPVLGLSLPEGNYRLTVATSRKPEISEAGIGGKTQVDAKALERFSMPVEAGEVLLVNVRRVP